MSFFLLISGIIVVAVTITDLIWTTLWVEGGAGPVVERLSSLLWRIIYRLAARNQRALSLAGPLILTVSLVTWILLFWAGWSLIFAASPYSISRTGEGGALTGADFIYYAGYTLFTLGNGDFSPSTGIWQIVTAFAAGTGMMVLTLGASYVLSILNAVVNSHSFASSVNGFGASSAEILLEAWNGKDFSRMDLMLIPLSSDLSRLTYQNQAYPLLHYYHAPRRKQAVEAVVPVLDDALSILRYAVSEEIRPNPLLLRNLRSSISDYLDSMTRDLIQKSEKPLPLPDLKPLRDHGIPVVSDEEFLKRMEQDKERRKKLKGLLTMDYWG